MKETIQLLRVEMATFLTMLKSELVDKGSGNVILWVWSL